MVDIDKVRRLCHNSFIRWTEHAVKQMLQRGITRENVLSAIEHGEVIENYPGDYPFPSCLILGIANGALHVVCGLTAEQVWIITAYRPDAAKWEADFRTRRKKLQ